jgi:hypothetical protein
MAIQLLREIRPKAFTAFLPAAQHSDPSVRELALKGGLVNGDLVALRSIRCSIG